MSNFIFKFVEGGVRPRVGREPRGSRSSSLPPANSSRSRNLESENPRKFESLERERESSSIDMADKNNEEDCIEGEGGKSNVSVVPFPICFVRPTFDR